MVATTCVSMLLLYVPLGQLLLGAEAIQFKHLVMAGLIASLPTFVLSGIKEVFRLRWL